MRLRAASLLAALLCLAAAAATAAPPGPPAAPSRSIAASPFFQQVTLAPCAAGSAVIHVANLGADPIRVEFSLEDLAPDGTPRQAGSLPTTLAGAVSLPSPVTLAPMASAAVSVGLVGQESTRMGIVLARTVPPGAAVGARVVLAPPGAAPSLSGSVSGSTSGAIRLELANAGDAAARVSGWVYITSGERFVGKIPVPQAVVLPKGSSTLALAWPDTLPPGASLRAVILADPSAPPVVLQGATAP